MKRVVMRGPKTEDSWPLWDLDYPGCSRLFFVVLDQFGHDFPGAVLVVPRVLSVNEFANAIAESR